MTRSEGNTYRLDRGRERKREGGRELCAVEVDKGNEKINYCVFRREILDNKEGTAEDRGREKTEVDNYL